MADLTAIIEVLPILNVLIIPALVFVVRIDRRMGQIDVLAAVNEKRIEKLEAEQDRMREKLVQIEYSTRHA